jgi:CASK-interacting protein
LTVGYQRGSRIDPITHKAAVYFHQQYGLQEDQGIDLTQSPGRDSPGSSSGSAGSGSGSRHSTVSLDSGRSSSYLTGSVDRMNQQSDHDVIANWLMILNSDELLPYAGNFSLAGYDLGTIVRMTPEDLTAIGITNPHHREIIKAHIDDLQVNDSLPHYVPGSIDEWLRLLRLDEYIQPLQNEGFQSVRDMTKLNEEDLEDIGIVKLGHQKKILLAIKRVKDILNGKVVVPCVNYCCQPTIANGPIYAQVLYFSLKSETFFSTFVIFLA